MYCFLYKCNKSFIAISLYFCQSLTATVIKSLTGKQHTEIATPFNCCWSEAHTNFCDICQIWQQTMLTLCPPLASRIKHLFASCQEKWLLSSGFYFSFMTNTWHTLFLHAGQCPLWKLVFLETGCYTKLRSMQNYVLICFFIWKNLYSWLLFFYLCINDSEDDFKLHAQAKTFVLRPICI